MSEEINKLKSDLKSHNNTHTMDQTNLSQPDTITKVTAMSSKQRLFTIKEAADELRVSKWLVYKLIQTNQISSLTIGTRRFIANEDIDLFINNQKRKEYAT